MPLGIDRRLLPIEPVGYAGGGGGWFATATASLARDWSVISEIPRGLEELEEEQRRLEAQVQEQQPFIPSGTVVLDRWNLPAPGEFGIVQQEDDEVTHTWGHLAREFVGGAIGDIWSPDPPALYSPGNQFIGPGSTSNQLATQAAMGGGGGVNGCDGMTWAGGAPPKGYKVVRDSCGNGVLRKVRRRRRRRMLTAGDKTDIASIVSMVGKGQLAASLINRSAS